LAFFQEEMRTCQTDFNYLVRINGVGVNPKDLDSADLSAGIARQLASFADSRSLVTANFIDLRANKTVQQPDPLADCAFDESVGTEENPMVGLFTGIGDDESIATALAERFLDTCLAKDKVLALVLPHRVGSRGAPNFEMKMREKLKRHYAEKLGDEKAGHAFANRIKIVRIEADATNAKQIDDSVKTLKDKGILEVHFAAHSMNFTHADQLRHAEDHATRATRDQFALAMDTGANSLAYWVQSLQKEKGLHPNALVVDLNYEGGEKETGGYGPVAPVKALLSAVAEALFEQTGVRILDLKAGAVPTRSSMAIPGFLKMMGFQDLRQVFSADGSLTQEAIAAHVVNTLWEGVRLPGDYADNGAHHTSVPNLMAAHALSQKEGKTLLKGKEISLVERDGALVFRSHGKTLSRDALAELKLCCDLIKTHQTEFKARGIKHILYPTSSFGANVGEFGVQFQQPDLPVQIRETTRLLDRLHQLPFTVAALLPAGPVLGGSLESALACDLRIAVEGTKVGLPEGPNFGMFPGYRGEEEVAALAGTTAAIDMVVHGKQFSGEAARNKGLVDHLLSEDCIDPEADAIAYLKTLSAKKLHDMRARHARPHQETQDLLPFFEELVASFDTARRNNLATAEGFERNYAISQSKGQARIAFAYEQLIEDANTLKAQALAKANLLLADPTPLAKYKAAYVAAEAKNRQHQYASYGERALVAATQTVEDELEGHEQERLIGYAFTEALRSILRDPSAAPKPTADTKGFTYALYNLFATFGYPLSDELTAQVSADYFAKAAGDAGCSFRIAKFVGDKEIANSVTRTHMKSVLRDIASGYPTRIDGNFGILGASGQMAQEFMLQFLKIVDLVQTKMPKEAGDGKAAKDKGDRPKVVMVTTSSRVVDGKTGLERVREATDKTFSDMIARDAKLTSSLLEDRVSTVDASNDASFPTKDFKEMAFVVECVEEKADLKIDNWLKAFNANPDIVVMTNTSTLNLDVLVKGLRKRIAALPLEADRERLKDCWKNVVGLHGFSPVAVMKAVEVVIQTKGPDGEPLSDKISDRPDAKAIALAAMVVQQMQLAAPDKAMFLVRGDSSGFLINRMLVQMFSQGFQALQSGLTPLEIDDSMKRAGWPLGVFALMDAVGLNTGLKVIRQVAADQPDHYPRGIADQLEAWIRAGVTQIYKKEQDPVTGDERISDRYTEAFKTQMGLPEGSQTELNLPARAALQTKVAAAYALEAVREMDVGVLPARYYANDADGVSIGGMFGEEEAIHRLTDVYDLAFVYGLNAPRGAFYQLDLLVQDRFNGDLKQFVAYCNQLVVDGHPEFAVPDSLRQRAVEGKHYFKAKPDVAPRYMAV
jgi:3-hydroxyacyl-CoA dehydrogenase/enoyl-CoA hydratase/carnithine racemase/enoyl-[acyl-carrier-protein] reductase (NADH)